MVKKQYVATGQWVGKETNNYFNSNQEGDYMGKRITLENIAKKSFYQIPKKLMHSSKYKGLSALSILAYAVLKDRASLSLKNNWYQKNEQGENEIYFIFTNTELMKVLEIGSTSTLSKVKKELEKFNLLEQERQGLNKPNKLFLLQIEAEKEDFSIISNEGYPLEQSLDNSGCSKSKRPESERPNIRKSNTSNTDINKTNKRLDTNDTASEFSTKTKIDYMQEAFYNNHERVPREITKMLKVFYHDSIDEAEKYYKIILKAKAKIEKEFNTMIWLENDKQATQAIIQSFSLTIRKIEREDNIMNCEAYVFQSIYQSLLKLYQYQQYKKDSPFFDWIKDNNQSSI